MIGLGTQDSLGQAEDFVNDFGTQSFTMLWDGSFQSWQAPASPRSPPRSCSLLTAHRSPTGLARSRRMTFLSWPPRTKAADPASECARFERLLQALFYAQPKP